MVATANFCNHINSLADKYYSPLWQEKTATEEVERDNLQALTASALFEAVHAGQVTQKDIQNLPPLVKRKITVEAQTFKEWLAVNSLTDTEIASCLLKRFNFKRQENDPRSNKQILLNRILDFTLKHASLDEKQKIIDNKRAISKMDRAYYSLVTIAEKIQSILAKIIRTEFVKNLVYWSMIIVSIVALVALYRVYPQAFLPLKKYYDFLALLPDKINASVAYKNLSWILGSILLVLTKKFPRIPMFLTTALFLFHAFFSEISILLSRPLFNLFPVQFIFAWLWGIPPFLLVLASAYMSDIATEFVSKKLNFYAEKLMNWRVNQEVSEIRTIWLNSFPPEIA